MTTVLFCSPRKNGYTAEVLSQFVKNRDDINLIDIFEPEAVSIGGSFVYFADVLLDKLKNNIQKKKYLFNTRKELIIIPAALGNDAGIIGACQ